MLKTTETAPVLNARSIVKQCVEVARGNGISSREAHPADRRATPRILFGHQVRYCLSSTLDDHATRPAQMLDISVGGVGLWCREALMEDAVVYLRLPLLDGRTGWVEGTVVYCSPDAEHYWVGVAFTLDERPIAGGE